MEQEIKQNEPVKLTKKQEILNFIKFTLFSISAGVIQILSFTICSELIFHDAGNEYGISYFIALFLSVLWNFTFNRKFTFKSAKNVPIAMLMVLGFYAVFTPLSIWWGIALTKAGWNEYIVLGLTMVINMVTEFLYTRYVVYRNSINTAVKKEKKDMEKTALNKENSEFITKHEFDKILISESGHHIAYRANYFVNEDGQKLDNLTKITYSAVIDNYGNIKEFEDIETTIKKRKKQMLSSLELIDNIVAECAISDTLLRMLIDKITVSKINGELKISITLNGDFRSHFDTYDELGEITERYSEIWWFPEEEKC